eukprot:gene4411-8784_t
MDPSLMLTSDQNPSYQNYLAKQILANPTKYGVNLSSAHTDDLLSSKSSVDGKKTDDMQKLNSLLDSIDSKLPFSTEDNKLCNTNTEKVDDVESPYDWSRQFDPSTNFFYYYNHRTGMSQWERPDGYIDTDVVQSSSTLGPSIDSISTSSDYTAQASFNAQSGRFSQSGTTSYWDKVGRQGDREGRQMSAFFDIQSLEQNRQEAKDMKKKILETKGIDWKQYKEERKKKRQKITNRWLYEDET